MKIIVTGGAGFIGSAVVRHIIENTDDHVLVLDSLTYAGNLASLKTVSDDSRFNFSKTDITNKGAVAEQINAFQPDIIMHLAAESHVDRSIDGPADFIHTNIIGTFTLLEAARDFYNNLPVSKKAQFRFHHISTDEVYGDLEGTTDLFTEETPYAPSSPYSASKASSDHLVRAWHRTYDLPVVITNCSNNYGPFHFPEKLIPLTILNALAGRALPIYGNGQQIRDWLYVEDHARALYLVATSAKIGETYNIGGHNERKNIEVVETICQILDKKISTKPANISSFSELITFVKDRPGHDARYAIDASKIANDLTWQPLETFETGIEKTVEWYLANNEWWESVLDGSYTGERLGLDTIVKGEDL